VWGFFEVPDGPARKRDVIAWWERRRLGYNLLVAACAVPSFCLYLFFLANSGHLAEGEDVVEPVALLAALVLGPAVVNACYTFGWIAELALRAQHRDPSRRAGPMLLKAGLAFSALVILGPTLCWGAVWVYGLAR
jgi:hypothetical protein